MTQSEHVRLLRKQIYELIGPIVLAIAVIATCGMLYGAAVLELGGAVLLFCGLGVGASVISIAAATVILRRRLRTLLQLSAGARADEHTLKVAALEVHRLADISVALINCVWAAGCSGVGLLLALLRAEVPLTIVPRIMVIGLVFGPISSMLAFFLVTQAARRTLLTIAGMGLTATKLTAALPANQRRLRARLMLFTGICVFSPVVLTADLGTNRASRGMQEIVSSDRARQPAMAQQAQSDALALAVGLGAMFLAISLVAAFGIGTLLGAPMQDVADAARRISAGRLGTASVIPAEDELWAVSAAFVDMQAHLHSVLSSLKGAGLRIGSTTEQLVASSRRSESGAADQASSLNQTSATTEELARSAGQIAENAAAVADLAQRTLLAAQSGQNGAKAFAATMARTKQDNQAVADSVLKLSKRVQQIGRIVEFINSVADKSDLLALNAELEGTKAGEVGRGFQLVASEMRRLAENVIESTKEIEGLIDEIRDATRTAVSVTEAGLHNTNDGAADADRIANNLGAVLLMAQRTSEAVRAISEATQQQQAGTDQLAAAMVSVLSVTQQNLTATRQVSAINVALEEVAANLRTMVEGFEA